VASVTQLHLRHYLSHYHVSIWMPMITNHVSIWVCTNHVSLHLVSFRHTSMHMLLWKKNTCTLQVSYWGQGFLTCIFLRAPEVRAKALLSMGMSIALPTRSVSDSVTPFFPAARGSCWFLLTPTLSLQSWFLRHVQHYKDIFIMIFWYVSVTHIFC
jgi:hypothetical protein